MDFKSIPLVLRIHAVAVLITAVVVAVTIKYGIGGGLQHMRYLRMQERLYSERLATQADLRNTVSEGQSQLQQVSQQTAGLEQLLPSEMNFQDFFGELNACAQAARCELSGLQPGQPQPGEGYQIMQVPFKVYGSFPALYDFLHRVLKAPRICKLERLFIRGGQQGTPFQADVVLNIYSAAAKEVGHAG